MISYVPRDDNKAIKARRQRLAQQNHRRKQHLLFLLIGCFFVISLTAGSYALLIKQAPSAVVSEVANPVVKAEPVDLTWPTNAEAAIGSITGGVLSASPNQTVAPTASVAKVMTAIMVLKKHPLKLGEQGPAIPITQKDVDSYNEYASKDGSTIPVQIGENLSEYQALQALLLPSANNIADTLAVWSYGSMEVYHSAANQYAKELGMKQSVIADDASGFSANTVSTPSDLVLLGQAAFKLPVIKQIVAQPNAELPLAGTVRNVNSLIANAGYSGIKTGNTEAAGGCFLFSSQRKVDNHDIIVIGAVMKAPTLEAALQSSQPLLESAFAGFRTVTIVKQNAVVGRYVSQWGATASLVASKDLSSFGWKGSSAQAIVTTPKLRTDSSKASFAGTASVATPYDHQTVPLTLQGNIGKPSIGWRLEHLW